MKTKTALGIIVVVSALSFLCASSAYAVYWRYNLKTAQNEAGNIQKPIMIDFYTEWCGWCKKLDADTYADSKVSALSKEFICVKIDGDKHRDLVAKYNIRGFPTIIFLNYEGAVDQSVVGYCGPEDFAKIMEGVLKNTKKPTLKKAGDQQNKAVARPQKKRGGSDFVLSGIIFESSKRPEAIINDTLVKEGDTIEGAKVLKITKTTVKLSLRGKDIILKMD